MEYIAHIQTHLTVWTQGVQLVLQSLLHNAVGHTNCSSQKQLEKYMAAAAAARLLFADDDPSILAAYSLFFTDHGYDVRTAEKGVGALAEYRAWRPDAVVLDIQMPGMDGWSVAREIRRIQSKPFPLLVAVTALSLPSERAESTRSGFDYHFVKPADLLAVLTAIASDPCTH